MRTDRLLLTLVAAATLTGVVGSQAGQAHAQNVGMCVARARGVPYEATKAPAWRDFTSSAAAACGGADIDCNYDDPRWRGATALTYNSATGSANPPVQFRSLWHLDGADRYLLLQWVIRIGMFGNKANAHDLFIGLERPNAATLPAGHRRAYVVQLHLYKNPSAPVSPVSDTGGDISNPTHCTSLPGAACSLTQDFFAVYQNAQGAGGQPVGVGDTCSTISGDGYRFEYVADSAGGAPAWLGNSAQYERRCAAGTADSCFMWVVSLRVPVVDVDATITPSSRPVEFLPDGIEVDLTNGLLPNLWYQVNMGSFDPGSGPVIAMLDSWPRNDAARVATNSDPWCQQSDDIFYKDLDDDNGGGPGTGPAPWAALHLWDGNLSTRPSDCFAGISLTPDDVGALPRDFDASGNGAPDDATVLSSSLARQFQSASGTGRATNAVVARPRNNTGADLSGVKLKARFRLAHWGIQPLAAGTSTATWDDLPDNPANGVCALPMCADGTSCSSTCGDSSACTIGGAPCADGTTCALGTAVCGDTSACGSTCGGIDIPGTDDVGTTYDDRRGIIKRDWTVGGTTDPLTEAGALEFCQYGLPLPSGSTYSCVDCPINPPTPCDPVVDPLSCGTHVSDGGAPPTGTCTRKLWEHQCMLVELDADNAADFENQSVYRNMNVREMSEVARDAAISLRGLPAIRGAIDETIYLVVMPRNMPATTGGSEIAGAAMVRGEAARSLARLLRPYRRAAERLGGPGFSEAVERVRAEGVVRDDLGAQVIAPPDGQEFPRPNLPRAAQLMPPNVRAVAEFLAGLAVYQPRVGSALAQRCRRESEHGDANKSRDACVLTELVLDTLDDVTATSIVPTLDVYAFRKGPGNRVVQLTSFSLVVHHEGPLFGVTWQIDNAVRVGWNVFRLKIPVGHKTRIQVRAMAKETPGAKQAPGLNHWPCQPGCCPGRQCSQPDLAAVAGNTLPIGLAGVIACGGFRRRRKGKGKSKS